MFVWGATREIPLLTLVVEVIQPGMIVIKCRRREGQGKFANIAVLDGDRIKLVDETSGGLSDCPSLVASLLDFSTPDTRGEPTNALVQLALSMRAHAHGATLLVVPHASAQWRRSIVWPVPYVLEPPYRALSDLAEAAPSTPINDRWIERFRKAVDAVGGLTAVDGATIVNDRFEVVAFGAKIARSPDGTPVDKLSFVEPLQGRAPSVVHPTALGGTRHLSAAQFVFDQRDALALVASQDGHFTVFAWSPCDAILQAFRIESLLM